MDQQTLDRFLDGISPEPNTGCWLWEKGCYPNGYGQISRNKRKILVHRLSYEHFVGPIPEGLQLDHLCRVRCCANPDHLEPVTAQVNQWRGSTFAADNHRKTHCKCGLPLSGENLYVTPSGARNCMGCRRESARKFRQKHPGYHRKQSQIST